MSSVSFSLIPFIPFWLTRLFWSAGPISPGHPIGIFSKYILFLSFRFILILRVPVSFSPIGMHLYYMIHAWFRGSNMFYILIFPHAHMYSSNSKCPSIPSMQFRAHLKWNDMEHIMLVPPGFDLLSMPAWLRIPFQKPLLPCQVRVSSNKKNSINSEESLC